jgi:response regulator RpfG family c-di-GMP phosphodiesterase
MNNNKCVASAIVATSEENRNFRYAQDDASDMAPDIDTMKLANIMIVDDEEYNILVVRRHLRQAGYQNFITTTDPTSVMTMLSDCTPDLVLLDVMMPEISGLELLQMMRGDDKFPHIPVIILTASSEAHIKLEALELGATDFLAKPVDASELVLRIRNTLLIKEHQDYLSHYNSELERKVRQRTAELRESQREVINCLGRAGEYHDELTSQHVLRVGRLSGILARQLGFDDNRIEMIELASQLHDIGKIGVSDTILLKPGPINPQEFDLIKRHCDYGAKIIDPEYCQQENLADEMTGPGSPFQGGCKSPIMKMAAIIANTHHEKWDGSGYPCGLAGEAIPIEGRITAVADVFDALVSKRPYKEAYSVEKAFGILENDRGTHFDPAILDAFFARRDDITQVLVKYSY